jgi:alkylation response protein AidB-like acyl-CoA dehydrogenase
MSNPLKSKLAKWPAVVLASLSLATAAYAQAGWNAQIRDVDAKFRKAMAKGDAAQLDRIVADDARIIHGNHGAIQDKRDLIERFRSYHIDTYDRTPVLSRVDRNLAVQVSITRKIAGGRETDTTTTEVFVRRSGRWQILVLQNTDHTDHGSR